MRKTFIFLAALLAAAMAIGQNQELTLEDAILYKNGDLLPQRMSGVQWMIGQEAITFYAPKSKRQKLVRATAQGQFDTILTITQLPAATPKNPIRSFSGYKWVDAETIFLRGKNSGYHYNLKSKTLKLVYATKQRTANNDIHYKTGLLAFTKDHNLYVADDEEELPVTEHYSPEVVAGQAIARSEYGITKGTFWSPSGKMLAFYEKDEADVDEYPITDITTTPATLKNIKYPMAGRGSEQAAVGIYHTLTRQVVYLKSDKARHDYFTNVGWGPDEKYIYVAELNRATDHMRLNKYNALTGDFVATLFEEKNDKWVEPEHPVFFATGAKNKFVWLSERDGFMNLYLYNTEGKLIRQLTKNKWVAKSIIGSSANGKFIFFTGTGKNPTETHIYKVSLTGKQTQLTKVAGTHSASISPSGKYFLDNMSSISNAGQASVCNTRDGRALFSVLTQDHPLKDYLISTPELFTIKRVDGTTDLHCRMIKPTTFDETKQYPVLVYVYGGPHAQMVTNRFNGGAPLWMNYMAERGYIIFTLDNRGSGNRGWTFESGIHRQLGELEMQDQLKGVEYLKSLPYVDASRMAVHGWSYGGYMTTSLMLKQPGTFKVGVAGGPVTNWAFYEVMYGERYMDTPEENPEGYAQTNLSNYVNNLQGDLMLIHGTVDPVVVMQHNMALVKAFVDAGVQIDFFPYPMHEHNVRGKDRIHLMRKVLDYVEDKLGK